MPTSTTTVSVPIRSPLFLFCNNKKGKYNTWIPQYLSCPVPLKRKKKKPKLSVFFFFSPYYTFLALDVIPISPVFFFLLFLYVTPIDAQRSFYYYYSLSPSPMRSSVSVYLSLIAERPFFSVCCFLTF